MFITFSMQGKRLKFDARSMMKENGTFTFRDQVHDKYVLESDQWRRCMDPL